MIDDRMVNEQYTNRLARTVVDNLNKTDSKPNTPHPPPLRKT